MFEFIKAWYQRYFTDPQAALLAVLILVISVVIYSLGKMLAPLLAAVIIAYLLEAPVQRLQRVNIPRIVAVTLVFLLFIAFMVFTIFVLLPILTTQVTQFFQEVPEMLNNGQALLLQLPQQYPDLISETAVSNFIGAIRNAMANLGGNVFSFSLASIPALITALVYLVLVPLMVFFFLKDKRDIQAWMTQFLPSDRRLVTEVWQEMDDQMGNYVRGKVYEIIIVGGVSYFAFKLLGLNYSSLLALLVGLSVLIPYIGAAAVTLPIAIVGYFQWGLSSDFSWLMFWYLLIQFLDGNVLVPILFSEAVNLHPVAIIAAILVFGGLWGFWGVFFAIPLATLVKALINVWPSTANDMPEEPALESA